MGWWGKNLYSVAELTVGPIKVLKSHGGVNSTRELISNAVITYHSPNSKWEPNWRSGEEEGAQFLVYWNNVSYLLYLLNFSKHLPPAEIQHVICLKPYLQVVWQEHWSVLANLDRDTLSSFPTRKFYELPQQKPLHKNHFSTKTRKAEPVLLKNFMAHPWPTPTDSVKSSHWL